MAFVKLNKLKSTGKAAAKKSAEHPLLKVDGVNENVKQMYLQGVVLGSLLDDGEITEKERAYVTALGASLGIEASDVASCIETVQQLKSDEDKEEFIKELLALMQPEAIALLFIADFEGIIDLNEKLSEELVEYLNYFGDGLFHREEWRDYVWDHEKLVDAQRVFARNLKAAEMGDAFAQAVVGQGYYNGQGVAKDFTQAAKWYKKSAEAGCVIGECEYAGCLREGKGVKQNLSSAIRYYERGASRGYAPAMVWLGAIYRDGNGVAQDYKKSYDWFLMCAKLQDEKFKDAISYAQTEVGILLRKGIGCVCDLQAAANWFLKSAESGYVRGMNWIGWCYHNGEGVEKNLKFAFEWQLKAAEQGYSYAEEAVAFAYRNGEGVDHDEVKAVKWIRKAAEHGLASSQFWYGLCFDQGTGMEKDPASAFSWYLRAAEQGYVAAENAVGNCYANSFGTCEDVKKAFEWRLKAAEHGNVFAMVSVGEQYIQGLGCARNWRKCFEWNLKAAELGYVIAQEHLGFFYQRTDDEMMIKKDMSQARMWLEKAAAQGSQDAKNELLRLA